MDGIWGTWSGCGDKSFHGSGEGEECTRIRKKDWEKKEEGKDCTGDWEEDCDCGMFPDNSIICKQYNVWLNLQVQFQKYICFDLLKYWVQPWSRVRWSKTSLAYFSGSDNRLYEVGAPVAVLHTVGNVVDKNLHMHLQLPLLLLHVPLLQRVMPYDPKIWQYSYTMPFITMRWSLLLNNLVFMVATLIIRDDVYTFNTY